MNEITKKHLLHTIISFMLAAGLTLPLIFILPFEDSWPLVLLINFALPAVLVLLKGHKKIWISLFLGFLIFQIFAIFRLPGGGTIVASISTLIKALSLLIKGHKEVLIVAKSELVIWISVILTIFAYAFTKDGTGFFPALFAVIMMLLALWFSSNARYLLYALPGVIAVIALYVRFVNQHTSVFKILPVVAFISLIAYLLLPSNGITIKPLEDTANKLRNAITDYLFFTQTRNVFSLDKEGYYLGEPADPSDQLVMIVQTPHILHLRGSIKNEYTGYSWLDTIGGQRNLMISPRQKSLREDVFDLKRPDKQFLEKFPELEGSFPVTVGMISSSQSTLFLTQRFEDLWTSEGLVPYFNNSSEVFITRDLYSQDNYRFNAKNYKSTNEDLFTICHILSSMDDKLYEAISSVYTSLPAHLEKELFMLVESITGSYDTPFQKAMAIERHLKQYYRYTLDPKPMKSNQDFVSYFLHVGKEGYCTYFASAMTVLSRMVGLPARYVEGYLAIPGDDGFAHVTGKNAHAWTEIYFPGFGWITFDATPGEHNESTPPQQETPPDTVGADEEPEEKDEETPDETNSGMDEKDDKKQEDEADKKDEEQESEPEENQNESRSPFKIDISPYLLFILILLALVALCIYMVLPAPMARRKKVLELKFLVWLKALYDLLRADNIAPKPQESPLAFAKRVNYEKKYPLSLINSGECLSYVGYSPHPFDKGYMDVVKETFLSLYETLPWYKKVKFIFMRAFMPRKLRSFHVPDKKLLLKKTRRITKTRRKP